MVFANCNNKIETDPNYPSSNAIKVEMETRSTFFRNKRVRKNGAPPVRDLGKPACCLGGWVVGKEEKKGRRRIDRWQWQEKR